MARLFDKMRNAVGGQEHELPGLWERYGDAFEGCTVLVREQNGQLAGTITQLPKRMTHCGWIMGDLKWRAIRRTRKNRYALQDLFKEIDAATRSIRQVTYQPAEIRLTGSSELILRCDPSAPSPFPTQRWLKIGRLPNRDGQ